MLMLILIAASLAATGSSVRSGQDKQQPGRFYSDMAVHTSAETATRNVDRREDGVRFYSDLNGRTSPGKKHRARQLPKRAKRKAASKLEESRAQCVDTTFSRDGDCSKHGGVFWRIKE